MNPYEERIKEVADNYSRFVTEVIGIKSPAGFSAYQNLQTSIWWAQKALLEKEAAHISSASKKKKAKK